MKNCQKVILNKKVNLQSIKESFQEINLKYRAVCALWEQVDEIDAVAKENDDTDNTRIFVSKLIKNSKEEIEKSEEKIKGIDKKFVELLEYYGENKDVTIDAFFEIFLKFNRDILV